MKIHINEIKKPFFGKKTFYFTLPFYDYHGELPKNFLVKNLKLKLYVGNIYVGGTGKHLLY